MKTKSKIIILIVVLSVCIVATVTGVTIAYWAGAEGTNQIAPQAETTDWSYYSKYFIYEEEYAEGGQLIGYKIVAFKDTVLENVIIPKYAIGGWLREKKDDNTVLTPLTKGNVKKGGIVVNVGNSVFANTTDKLIPVTLTIPTTVDVEPGAFVGLVNLTKVTIKSVNDTQGILDTTITIGQNAFSGCYNVSKFVAPSHITINVPGVDNDWEKHKIAMGLVIDELKKSEL